MTKACEGPLPPLGKMPPDRLSHRPLCPVVCSKNSDTGAHSQTSPRTSQVMEHSELLVGGHLGQQNEPESHVSGRILLPVSRTVVHGTRIGSNCAQTLVNQHLFFGSRAHHVGQVGPEHTLPANRSALAFLCFSRMFLSWFPKHQPSPRTSCIWVSCSGVSSNFTGFLQTRGSSPGPPERSCVQETDTAPFGFPDLSPVAFS